MTNPPNKSMHTNRRQAFQFRCSGFFGRWIRSQCPFPAAVGDFHHYAMRTFLISLCIASHLYAGDTNSYSWKPPWGTAGRGAFIDAAKATSITNGISYGQIVSNLGPGYVSQADNTMIPRWYFTDGRRLWVWPKSFAASDVLHSNAPDVQGHFLVLTQGTFCFETNSWHIE